MLEPYRISQKDILLIEDVSTRLFALTGLVRVRLSSRDLTGALKTARMIAPGYPRASSFKSLAETALHKGDKPYAREYLKEAVVAANTIQGDIARADTLWRLSTSQAETGDISEARATARTIEMEYHRGTALREIGTLQAKAGDITGALETFSILKTDHGQQDHRGAICNAAYLLAHAGNLQNSRQLAREVSDQEPDSCTLNIAHGQAEAGDVAGALSTVAPFISPEVKAMRLRESTRLY
jgi:hypothetical protein